MNLLLWPRRMYMRKTTVLLRGEISAPMLSSLDVDAIIIGHSERRQYFGESNESCKVKIEPGPKQ